MFFTIGVLKNFAVFTGKHLCWILFLLQAWRLRYSPVKIAKFLRTAFFIEHLWWMLLRREVLMKKIHSSDTLAINMVIPAKNVIISNANNAIDREKPSDKLKWKNTNNLTNYLSNKNNVTKTILTHSSHWNILTYSKTYSTEWN